MKYIGRYIPPSPKRGDLVDRSDENQPYRWKLRAPCTECCNQVLVGNIGRRFPCVMSRPTVRQRSWVSDLWPFWTTVLFYSKDSRQSSEARPWHSSAWLRRWYRSTTVMGDPIDDDCSIREVWCSEGTWNTGRVVTPRWWWSNESHGSNKCLAAWGLADV